MTRRLSLLCLLLGSGAPFAATIQPAGAQQSATPVSAPAAPVPLPPAIPEAQDVAFPGVIGLTVDTTGPVRGIWHVTEEIPVAVPGRLTLRYAKFLPGNHGPSGPIEAVAGLTFTANGRPLTWTRDPVDVFAFHVDVPRGVTRITAEFDYLSDQPGSIGRTEHTANMINVEWEKVSLYPAGYYARRIPIRATIVLPAGFTAVSAIDGEPRQGGRIVYPQTDYETLVDSPLLGGRHFRSWALGHDVDLDAFADSPELLNASAEQIAAHSRMVDQAVMLFGSRRFDRYDLLLGLSSQLSGIGLEHHRSSENITTPQYFTDWAGTAGGRTLLPHEFTHSWNGKYRRPADLWAPDYNRPTQNSLLWVYEGLTPYIATLLGARSGLTTREEALAEITENAASYAMQDGRRWRSLEDTTHQQLVFQRRRPQYGSWQRGTDYYDEAALVWLEADMRIRQLSGGRKSLDDFARAFFAGRDGDWGTSLYTFDDVVRGLNQVQPYDWAKFLRDRVYTPGAPAPVAGLELGGYRLVWRDTPDAGAVPDGYADLRYSMGIAVNPTGRVPVVQWDSAAFRAGLRPETTILTVNGQSFSAAGLIAAVTANRAGRAPIRLRVRDGSEERDVTIDYRGGLRYPHLERIGSGPALLDAALTPRTR